MIASYFTAKPDAAIVETDREEFTSKLKKLWVQGCEYFQKFSGSKISKYYTIVASASWDAFRYRIDQVNEMYGIFPCEIRKSGSKYHAIYQLSRPLNKTNTDKLSSILKEVLLCDTQYWAFFSDYEKVFEDKISVISIEDIERVGKYILWGSTTVWDSINDSLLDSANFVPAKDVIEIFGRSEDIDDDLNIIIWYWKPFAYVREILGSLDAALKFFNEHFSIGFQMQDNTIDTYFVDGILSKSEDMIQLWGGYAVETEKGNIRITDFTIRVHYKLLREDKIAYAISLVGKDGKKTAVFQWSNSVSEANLVEIVQSLGNYHFITPLKKYLIMIHSMIAATSVPTIYVLPRYGRNIFMGSDVMVYANGVFDIKRKMYFPKSPDASFYFLDGTDWFVVQDFKWRDYDETTIASVPSIKSTEVYSFDDYKNIFHDLYKDITGDFLVMACCTYMWFGLFSEENVSYNPMFCGHWVTGSGKTTFAEYIKMMLWVDWDPVVFGGGTTNFALLTMLGRMNKLPIMCSEFRAWSEDANGKEAMFRSLYDRNSIAKGNVQQTITTYELVASIFVEWEELPNDGAVRSRMIHKRLAKRYQNLNSWIDIHQVIASGKSKIEAFMHSYQISSDKDVYDECIVEWRTIFGGKWKEPRVLDNICMMYASCMAFDKSRKDYYIETLKIISLELNQDVSDNGTGMQIIKAMWLYASGRWSKIYTDERNKTVIVPWYDLVAYVKRQKVDLSLNIESYRDHLVEMWFEEWMFEIEEKDEFGMSDNICVDWFSIHISKCPKELFIKKEIFRLYKSLSKI